MKRPAVIVLAALGLISLLVLGNMPVGMSWLEIHNQTAVPATPETNQVRIFYANGQPQYLDWTGATNLFGPQHYGGISFQDVSDVGAVSLAFAATRAFTNVHVAYNTTMATNAVTCSTSAGTITIQESGTYSLSFSLAGDSSGAAKVHSAGVVKNFLWPSSTNILTGTYVDFTTQTGAGNTVSVASAVALVVLAANDVLSLAVRNETDTAALNLHSINFSIRRVK